MDMITDFFKAFIYEIIFTLIISTGAVTFCFATLRNTINIKKLGIHRVHKEGKDINNMIKAIKKSRQIKIISFMPYNFVYDHKDKLVQKIKDGCNIKLLISNKDSLLLRELCQIKRNVDDDIAREFEPLINLLKNIKQEAGIDSTGMIEVRTYNTEIRNPSIICIGENESTAAFLTVSLPPKRSIDSLMLEFKDDDCIPVVNYFDKIWNRHGNDVVFSSLNP